MTACPSGTAPIAIERSIFNTKGLTSGHPYKGSHTCGLAVLAVRCLRCLSRMRRVMPMHCYTFHEHDNERSTRNNACANVSST